MVRWRRWWREEDDLRDLALELTRDSLGTLDFVAAGLRRAGTVGEGASERNVGES